ncbi:hypothetical protein APHAL10511_001544 [Amanita phalloides]|nr:hypothetical protein APHAL10511_001544 [Amanita phalloides]
MGIDSWSILAQPWHWLTSPSPAKSSSSGQRHHRHLSKKYIRTRAEQQASMQNGSAKHDFDGQPGYYPGLVNISGTYCFMNSTLQALASLSYLQPHIDAVHAKAEERDVPTPVIDTLQTLFRRLNTPRSSYHSIRPVEIIDALTNVEGRTNALFYSREHQDAQELFQLLSECVKNEITAVDKEGKRDRGLGGLSQNLESTMEFSKSVFDGLTANRRSCVTCEYTEAVMHFSLDNLQLSLPRLAAMCRLEECLEDYTHLEILRDCVCRKCSLVSTHRRLRDDVALLEEATKPELNPSSSKKKRLRDHRRMEGRVRLALEEGRIEDDLKDVRMERVISPATKQTMIARPPPVLALHINRSIHYGHYASKNTIRLIFPEVLDITPYTTSGNLSLKPTSSISTPSPHNSTAYTHPRRSISPPSSTHHRHSKHNPSHHSRTLYRLSAVVCHYGQHSFGHYICYRRKPRSAGLPKEKRWAPPTLIDPLLLHELGIDMGRGGSTEFVPAGNGDIHPTAGIEGDGSELELDFDAGSKAKAKAKARANGKEPDSPRFIWDNEDPSEYGRGTGRGWLRISDDAVGECGIESVLVEGSSAFMLYYERVVVDVPGVYPSRGVVRKVLTGEGGAGRVRGQEVVETSVGEGEGVGEGEVIGEGEAEGEAGAEEDEAGRESEETLRPRIKTIVMNGSVGTLASEVGVGVMIKAKEKARPAVSVSTEGASGRPSSVGVEPRVIRSVEAGRKKFVTPSSSAPSPTETTSEPTSRSASTSTLPSGDETWDTAEDRAETPLSMAETPTNSKFPLEELPNGAPSSDPHTNTHATSTLSFPHASLLPSFEQNQTASTSTQSSFSRSPSSSPSLSSSSPSPSPSPSSSPSKSKPNTLKRKSRHSHSSGKKPSRPSARTSLLGSPDTPPGSGIPV